MSKEEAHQETLLCVNRLWEELNASIGFVQYRCAAPCHNITPANCVRRGGACRLPRTCMPVQELNMSGCPHACQFAALRCQAASTFLPLLGLISSPQLLIGASLHSMLPNHATKAVDPPPAPWL